MLEQSYTSRPAGSATAGASPERGATEQYWTLAKVKEAYTDYLFNKREEVNEQIDSRRYYHGAQWTEEQIAVMKRRKQPIMTFNRTARKINGVIGLIERLRQEPKAYPRTPQHEQGAELATAVVRYVLDEQEWKAKSPLAGQDGAIDGIGGIGLEIGQGDQGDPDIEFDLIDIQAFFYDPRSYKMDFSDARYMGIGKWMDEDIAEAMFPDAPLGSFGADNDLTNSTDRENRWFRVDGVVKRVRIVDIWYKHKGGWCWAIFTGSTILMEGKSYLKDQKKKDLCKYIMYSAGVDHDGDRYGFIRNMKSAQDGINARQSKMQHILASRRLMISQGAVADVEKVRAEWARPDGVIVTNGPVNEGAKADDQSFDFAGWTKMLELNLAEIENFGPNPALIGQGVESKSGRAIQLLQQAGMAELGPFILAFRGWKIRVYRAIWNAVQQHWTKERWIRVTDNDDLAQFIQINGIGLDQNGMPTIINAVGSLDVDIIMDEGPDSLTMAQDTYDTLLGLAQNGAQVPPDVLIELSPGIDSRTKKLIKKRLSQQAEEPPPELQKAQIMAQIEQQKAQQAAELKQQDMQLNVQLDAQKQQSAATLQREQTLAELELEREKAAAEIQLAREKAQAELELKAAIAQQECEIKQHCAMIDNDMEEKRMEREDARAERKMDTEARHAERKIDLDAKAKAEAAKDKESDKKPAREEGKSDAVMAAALTAVAHAIKQSSAPRSIRKGADGSYRSEVG